jgi:hypothetical protein
LAAKGSADGAESGGSGTALVTPISADANEGAKDASADQSPESSDGAAAGGDASGRVAGGTGKGIRSLADLQAAIKKADRVKKQAQTKGKIEQLRRDRQMRKPALTKEEKKLVRASKRLTLELTQTESRVKGKIK